MSNLFLTVSTMKRKTGKAHLNDLWEHMCSNLEAFIKEGDQEKLHQFRVNVKKIRAFLLLVDAALSQNTLSKQFKPVKKIFRHGGKIREAYINLQLGTHYELKNDDFNLKQVNEMEKEILLFREKAKKYLKTISQVHDELEDNLEAIEDNRISEFYQNQLGQIAVTLDKHEFNEELHECRKRIKILVYNRKVAGKALNGNLNLNNDYLDQLQDSIGNWHDTTIAIELFSAPELNVKPVVSRIKRQNTRLRKSINELSKDFFARATFKNDTEQH
jgi:CHAD domain-containing protein